VLRTTGGGKKSRNVGRLSLPAADMDQAAVQPQPWGRSRAHLVCAVTQTPDPWPRRESPNSLGRKETVKNQADAWCAAAQRGYSRISPHLDKERLRANGLTQHPQKSAGADGDQLTRAKSSRGQQTISLRRSGQTSQGSDFPSCTRNPFVHFPTVPIAARHAFEMHSPRVVVQNDPGGCATMIQRCRSSLLGRPVHQMAIEARSSPAGRATIAFRMVNRDIRHTPIRGEIGLA